MELKDTMTVADVDRLTRKVEAIVYRETGVILAGVGVYSCNTGNPEAKKLLDEISSVVLSHEWALGLHGFYVDFEAKKMRFDVVMSFDISPRDGLNILYEEINRAYPDYDIFILPDVDVSD